MSNVTFASNFHSIHYTIQSRIIFGVEGQSPRSCGIGTAYARYILSLSDGSTISVQIGSLQVLHVQNLKLLLNTGHLLENILELVKVVTLVTITLLVGKRHY